MKKIVIWDHILYDSIHMKFQNGKTYRDKISGYLGLEVLGALRGHSKGELFSSEVMKVI